MKRMITKIFQHLHVNYPLLYVLQTKYPPNNTDWEEYLINTKNAIESLPKPYGYCMVISDGGSLTVEQRNSIIKQFKKYPKLKAKTAYIITNSISRGIMTALRWISPSTYMPKPFKPQKIHDAFEYLGINKYSVDTFWQVISKMDQEVGRTKIVEEIGKVLNKIG